MMIFLLYRTHTDNGQTLKYTKYIKLNIQLLVANLIEIGSNSNGSYIKYSNGILVCYHTLSVKGDQEITLPKYYKDQHYVCQVQLLGRSVMDMAPVTITSNIGFKVNIYGYNGSVVSNDRVISYFTLGKWK